MPRFIFMLTHNDRTVPDALSTYRSIRDTAVELVGFKDIGLPMSELHQLTQAIHDDGRKVMLEVVSESHEAELASARAARALGVDFLLGGRHAREVVMLLEGSGIRYFPFAGCTVGHPTRLEGSLEEIVCDAKTLASLPGVHGLDLLAYRSCHDGAELTAHVSHAVRLPVIAAGSIDRFERVAAIRDAGAWAFTIGTALFDGAFVECSLHSQINRVLDFEGVSA